MSVLKKSEKTLDEKCKILLSGHPDATCYFHNGKLIGRFVLEAVKYKMKNGGKMDIKHKFKFKGKVHTKNAPYIRINDCTVCRQVASVSGDEKTKNQSKTAKLAVTVDKNNPSIKLFRCIRDSVVRALTKLSIESKLKFGGSIINNLKSKANKYFKKNKIEYEKLSIAERYKVVCAIPLKKLYSVFVTFHVTSPHDMAIETGNVYIPDGADFVAEEKISSYKMSETRLVKGIKFVFEKHKVGANYVLTDEDDPFIKPPSISARAISGTRFCNRDLKKAYVMSKRKMEKYYARTKRKESVLNTGKYNDAKVDYTRAKEEYDNSENIKFKHSNIDKYIGNTTKLAFIGIRSTSVFMSSMMIVIQTTPIDIWYTNDRQVMEEPDDGLDDDDLDDSDSDSDSDEEKPAEPNDDI